jgi:hypothetical protein
VQGRLAIRICRPQAVLPAPIDELRQISDRDPLAGVVEDARSMRIKAYSDEREPSYYELLQQAWVLQPGGRGKPAGFVRASDLRDAEVDRFLSAMGEVNRRRRLGDRSSEED